MKNIHVFLFAVISFLFYIKPNISAQNPITENTSDSLTLVKVAQKTKVDNWVNPWDFSQPVYTWHGVELNSEGRVEELHLENNNLDGTISPKIGDLTSLKLLRFDNNNLKGSLVPAIKDLVNL